MGGGCPRTFQPLEPPPHPGSRGEKAVGVLGETLAPSLPHQQHPGSPGSARVPGPPPALTGSPRPGALRGSGETGAGLYSGDPALGGWCSPGGGAEEGGSGRSLGARPAAGGLRLVPRPPATGAAFRGSRHCSEPRFLHVGNGGIGGHGQGCAKAPMRSGAGGTLDCEVPWPGTARNPDSPTRVTVATVSAPCREQFPPGGRPGPGWGVEGGTLGVCPRVTPALHGGARLGRCVLVLTPWRTKWGANSASTLEGARRIRKGDGGGILCLGVRTGGRGVVA